MKNEEKYYTYRNDVVLNNNGHQCELIGGKISCHSNVLFTPTSVLSPNFTNGTIEVIVCEMEYGCVAKSKYGYLLCSFSRLREVTEQEAIKILERQVNTISDYLSEKEQNNE